MFEHLRQIFSKHKIFIIIGVTLSLGYWLFEGLLDFHVFGNRSIDEIFFPSDTHELWMRLPIIFILVGFSIYAQIIMNKLNGIAKEYSTLFENAPDAIFIADCESGIITNANPAASQLLLRPHNEIIGLHQTQLHPKLMNDDSTKIFNLQIEQNRKKKKKQAIEHVVIRSDGIEVPVEILAKTVDIGDRSIIQGIFRNITERKKIEKALKESEERYRSVVEDSPGLLCRFEPGGIITFINDAYCKYFNKDQQELIGKTFFSLIPEQDRERVAANINSLTLDAPVQTHEHHVISSDGQTRWQRWTNRALFDNNGQIFAYQSFGEDITDLKEAEQKILKLSSAVEQSIDGIAISDMEPRFEYVNDAYARMHGYTSEEMVGMMVADIQSDEHTDTFKGALYHMKTQGVWIGESGHIRRDGIPFPTQMSATMLKSEKGEPIGFIAVCRDITESKKKDEKLNLYREEMARAERLASIGILTATTAHELAQPLTILRLSLENTLNKMETTSSPEGIIEKLKECLVEVSNISLLLNKIRNFARITSDRIATVTELDVEVICKKIVNIFNDITVQEGIALHLRDLEKLPRIYSNEKDIEQLFFSLIHNAIYESKDRRDRRLLISGKVKEEQIELRFDDNCGGIAPENLDKIFDPFFTTKSTDQGMGLGLSIVQNIVSRSGGKIRVESEFGRGSSFIVTLPISKKKSE